MKNQVAVLAVLICAAVLLPIAVVTGLLPPEALGAGLLLGAVAANQVTPRSGEDARVKILAGNAEVLYGGTLVFYDAGGYAVATAGGNIFAGVLTETKVDNSSGADGAASGEVYISGSFVLTGSGFSQATCGEDIYASDNYTVTTTSAGNSRIGVCTEYISSTKIRVKIEVGSRVY